MSARLATLRHKPRPLSKRDMKRRYWDDGKSCVDIAREVGVDPKTVWAWMRFYGIETRPRGNVANLSTGAGKANGFYGRKHSRATKRRLRAIAIADGRLPWGKNNPHPRPRGKDHPSWKGGCSAERQAFYASNKWKIVAPRVWTRDKSTCRRCGKLHARGKAFDIHHIVPFTSRKLRAVLSNLILLCEPCHYWVHSRLNSKRRFL